MSEIQDGKVRVDYGDYSLHPEVWVPIEHVRTEQITGDSSGDETYILTDDEEAPTERTESGKYLNALMSDGGRQSSQTIRAKRRPKKRAATCADSTPNTTERHEIAQFMVDISQVRKTTKKIPKKHANEEVKKHNEAGYTRRAAERPLNRRATTHVAPTQSCPARSQLKLAHINCARMYNSHLEPDSAKVLALASDITEQELDVCFLAETGEFGSVSPIEIEGYQYITLRKRTRRGAFASDQELTRSNNGGTAVLVRSGLAPYVEVTATPSVGNTEALSTLHILDRERKRPILRICHFWREFDSEWVRYVRMKIPRFSIGSKNLYSEQRRQIYQSCSSET